jgi:SAM-dependent methyltransferase
MVNAYDAFASDYGWLLSDDLTSGEEFLRSYGSVIGNLPRSACVLDCACGTGTDAVALARLGFQVDASDASSAMVEQARQSAREAGVNIAFHVADWRELPSVFDHKFDAVFCIGNSLAHLPDETAMIDSLIGMRQVLNDGGVLVVSSRDWERLRSESPRVSVAPQVIERNGIRCLSIYIWTIPEEWTDPHRTEIVLVFDDGQAISHRRYELDFVPFTQKELLERIMSAGLLGPTIGHETDGRYWISAVARG